MFIHKMSDFTVNTLKSALNALFCREAHEKAYVSRSPTLSTSPTSVARNPSSSLRCSAEAAARCSSHAGTARPSFSTTWQPVFLRAEVFTALSEVKQLNATRTRCCYLVLPVPWQLSRSTCRKQKEGKVGRERAGRGSLFFKGRRHRLLLTDLKRSVIPTEIHRA